VRDVVYMMLACSEDCSGHDRKCCVFCTADIDHTFQAFSAPDNELVQKCLRGKRFYYSNGIPAKKEALKVSVEISSHRVFVVYFYMREFIIYQDDDDKWVAECKELPGYRASGKTKDEALQKIKGALLIYHPCRCED
jgi:predicted RNase H-like HicB family nuclease